MEPTRAIAACITSLLALAAGVYTLFAARGKGPILSNSYLYRSREERAKLDKQAEYRRVSIVFGSLAAVFALLTLHICTRWIWPFVLMWAVIAFVLVYAVADAVAAERGKRRK